MKRVILMEICSQNTFIIYKNYFQHHRSELFNKLIGLRSSNQFIRILKLLKTRILRSNVFKNRCLKLIVGIENLRSRLLCKTNDASHVAKNNSLIGTCKPICFN